MLYFIKMSSLYQWHNFFLLDLRDDPSDGWPYESAGSAVTCRHTHPLQVLPKICEYKYLKSVLTGQKSKFLVIVHHCCQVPGRLFCHFLKKSQLFYDQIRLLILGSKLATFFLKHFWNLLVCKWFAANCVNVCNIDNYCCQIQLICFR